MTARENELFELGGIKYKITKVRHLTTGRLSEVCFEHINEPFTKFIRSGKAFLEKTGHIFTDDLKFESITSPYNNLKTLNQ